MSKQSKKKSKQNKATKPKTTLKATPQRRLAITLGIILAVLAVILYGNTLNHEYTLDDFSAIKENFVTKKGVEGLPEIFSKSYRYGYWSSNGTLYRPLSLAMFAVEWELSEDNPTLYHGVNILLYALTAFLLFWTLWKIFPQKQGLLLAFIAALIFIVHPLHVEVVANIKSRDEILSFMFCVLAIYCFAKYLKSNKINQLIFAVLAYTIAMFSKENAVTFLAVFPLIAFFFFKKEWLESGLKSTVFLIPVAIYLLTRRMVLGKVSAGSGDVPALDNVLATSDSKLEQLSTAFMFCTKYIKNLFVPHPLGSDFGFPEYQAVGFNDWRALLGFALLAGIAVLGILGLKKRKLWSFAALYFLITFSIVSNLVLVIGTSYGDRMMYMPSLGFAIAIAALIGVFIKKQNEQKAENLGKFFSNNILALGIAGLIALAFSIKTITRNPVWKNSYSLYHNDINLAPNSAKLNYHYGLELNKKGLAATQNEDKKFYFEAAMNRFRKSTELYPTYADAFGQIGLMFYRNKQTDLAIANYEKAIGFKPSATVYSNLGTVLFESGRLQEAIEAYKNAVRYNPRFVDALRNLGSSYAQTRQFDLALDAFQKALKYAPNDATIHYYMGLVYKDKGDAANSKIWLEKAYQLNPALRK